MDDPRPWDSLSLEFHQLRQGSFVLWLTGQVQGLFTEYAGLFTRPLILLRYLSMDAYYVHIALKCLEYMRSARGSPWRAKGGTAS